MSRRKITLEFLRTEAGAGVALGLAALAALVVANSPLSGDYFAWLKSVQPVQLGPMRLDMTVSDWIKEGLMALFFLVVGLEIKYEILRGELSDPRTLATPIVAAVGGMIAPALVYLSLVALIGAPAQGWPIPLATDIAFALAVFALVGRGLPASLRIFLLTLAIVDDLGAIALIAILFSQDLAWAPLAWAAVLLGALALIGSRRGLPAPIWIMAFAVVWWLSVKAGLSTSLSAVAFAAIVPVSPRAEDGQSPLREAMHDLHPYVAFVILPIFAFAKAGASFQGLSSEQLLAPLSIAIALGLFIGKQAGVFGATVLVRGLRLGALPSGATWLQLYGVSLLCGVGFTMSLFIGALAFPGAADSVVQTEVRLGVIGGSLMSAIVGAFVLAGAGRRKDLTTTGQEEVLG